jgi:exosome complex component CSL4
VQEPSRGPLGRPRRLLRPWPSRQRLSILAPAAGFYNAAGVGPFVQENESVEPGAPLAYSEELLPGAGTYDDGEQIRAALYGTKAIDPQTMTLSVKPHGKSVASIEQGDIVVGLITYMKSDLASVQILAVRGKEGRSLLQNVEGTLHVSKVDNRYIAELSEEYRCGDLIRAKVLSLKGGPQLATDKPDLGCIKAFSRNDPTLMLSCDGHQLVDPEDGHEEHRKLASDYGSGTL